MVTIIESEPSDYEGDDRARGTRTDVNINTVLNVNYDVCHWANASMSRFIGQNSTRLFVVTLVDPWGVTGLQGGQHLL